MQKGRRLNMKNPKLPPSKEAVTHMCISPTFNMFNHLSFDISGWKFDFLMFFQANIFRTIKFSSPLNLQLAN